LKTKLAQFSQNFRGLVLQNAEVVVWPFTWRRSLIKSLSPQNHWKFVRPTYKFNINWLYFKIVRRRASINSVWAALVGHVVIDGRLPMAYPEMSIG